MLCLVFAASIVRFAVFDGPRRIAIVDEVLYYDLARSIRLGWGLSFRGFETAFRKILYPFVLSPFFGLADASLRLKAIHLFNCLLIGSSAVPAWLVARRLGISAAGRILSVAALLFWPDMLFASTFMAENVFWPICFWTVLLWTELDSAARGPSAGKTAVLVSGGCALSILAVAGYLAKEAFSAVVFAMVAVPVAEAISRRSPRSPDGRGRFVPSARWRFLAWAVPFLLCFAVLLSGLGSFLLRGMAGYRQARPERFRDWTVVLEGIRSLFGYAGGCGLALLFLPFVAPVAGWKRLDGKAKRLFAFSVSAIAAVAAGVAVSILPSESAGSVPRLHLRYSGPLLFSVLLVSVAALERIRPEDCRKTAVLLPLFALPCLFFQHRWVVGSGVDNFVWTVREPLSGLRTPLPDAVAFVPAAAAAFFFFRKKTAGAVVWACFFAAALGLEQFRGGSFVKGLFRENAGKVLAAREMSDWFRRNAPAANVVLVGDLYSPGSFLFDTYFDRRFLLASRPGDIESAKRADRVSDCPWHYGKWAKGPVRLDRIDYLVLAPDHLRHGIGVKHAVPVPEASFGLFRVFRNLVPEESPFDVAVVYDGSRLDVGFSGSRDRLSEIVRAGLGETDGTGAWIDGPEMAFRIPSAVPRGEEGPVSAALSCFSETDRVPVSVLGGGGETLWSGLLSGGASTMRFETSARNGFIRFVMVVGSGGSAVRVDGLSVSPSPETPERAGQKDSGVADTSREPGFHREDLPDPRSPSARDIP